MQGVSQRWTDEFGRVAPVWSVSDPCHNEPAPNRSKADKGCQNTHNDKRTFVQCAARERKTVTAVEATTIWTWGVFTAGIGGIGPKLSVPVTIARNRQADSHSEKCEASL
jgi:hypothetical protein